MARKCSHCGNYGHNSRTCNGGSPRDHAMALCDAAGCGGGLRLFGVQLHVVAAADVPPMVIKRSCSMDCLAPPPFVSPSPSSSSSLLLSIDEGPERACNHGYLSDGPPGRIPERKKGVPWSEEEHRLFLAGLEKLGKGDWRGISRSYVTTRTPTQVASHAQKFFLRQSSLGTKKRRSSLFDMVPIGESRMRASEEDALMSLSLGVSRREVSRKAATDEEESSSCHGIRRVSSAGAVMQPFALEEHAHAHCAPLDLELGMSLPRPAGRSVAAVAPSPGCMLRV